MHKRSAAQWAAEQPFTPEQVDCTTSVVLKILDGKCKMTHDAQQSVMAIYDVVKGQVGEKFGDSVHQAIADVMSRPSQELSEKIHNLRLHAEATIPKPIMKRYKAMLAEALQ